MLQLLSPAGLWTLAALALPLAIHLWRPPPMTVRLGSLRFLENLPHRRLRNLRWRERTLLAARLALLAVLALLMAGPRWQTKPPAGSQRWMLVDPNANLSGEFAERLRQLRANGYAVHQLAPGLPTIGSPTRPPAPANSVTPPDLWSLLREADAALPPGSTLAVFTPGRLAALHGARPALRHCRVEWISAPDVAGTGPHAWIDSLGRIAPAGKSGSTRVVVGTSNGASTTFRTAQFPPPLGTPTSTAVEFSANGVKARLSGAVPGAWLEAPPAPAAVRVLIVHDPDRAEDARYVKAAARAVAAVTGAEIDIHVRALDGNVSQPAADWVFWLAAQPVPDALANATPNLVTDAGTGPRDTPATIEDWIVAPSDVSGAAMSTGSPIHLWRRTSAPAMADPGEALWTDGHGAPLLTRTRTTRGQHWKFCSRFHPDWNELPRIPALAIWMRGLLLPAPADSPVDSFHDLRLADPSQYTASLVPVPATDRQPTSPAAVNVVDLHWPLWLLAVGLFAVERFLSRRPARESAAVPPAVPATVSAR